MEDRGFDLEDRVAELERTGRKRTLAPADRVGARGYFAPPPEGQLPVLESEERLVFGSENYLGLTDDRRIQDAARQAAATVGTGAGSSRLVTGDTIVHHDLERLLAETVATDRTLAFTSGYAASVGTVATLEPDAVFVDEVATAGVVDGCRLAGAETIRYEHRDASSLRSKLEARAAEAGGGESWLIATESVFGEDGAVAPLAAVCDVAEAFGAWVMVDETHATGLYANGGGIVRAEGLEDRVDVQVGSLATALASQGGFVAGDDALIECLVTDARPFACSRGLAPSAAAAASEALHVARHGDVRERLWNNVTHLRDGLESIGYDVVDDSQIVTVDLGDRRDAVDLAAGVRDRGIVAPPNRPPTASDDAGRVRVVPTASHEEDDVVRCLEAFRAAGNEVGLL